MFGEEVFAGEEVLAGEEERAFRTWRGLGKGIQDMAGKGDSPWRWP